MTDSTPAAPFLHAIRTGPWRIELDPRVTFLVGENGSGKSTLVEAIAVAAKLNAEGDGHTQQFSFSTRSSHSSLHRRCYRGSLRPSIARNHRAPSARGHSVRTV